MDNNLYSLLGVDTNASSDELKKAYREKAKALHPDRSPSTVDQFKAVVEAYKILSNPKSREDYDRNQKAKSSFSQKFSKAASSAAGVAAKVVDDLIDKDIFDAFDEFLRGQLRPKDIETSVSVTLEELYNGSDIQVSYKRNEVCGKCRGRGAATREDFERCKACYGLGYKAPQHIAEFIGKKQECGKCKGRGKIILNACNPCKGKGLIKKSIELTIPLPKDLNIWSQNDRLIVPEEGEHGGNLLIQVNPKDHIYFDVDYPDLEAEVPIKFYQAILGGLLEIDTLKGSALFRVEPGTEDGEIIPLAGYGLRQDENTVGELRVKIKIQIPKRISKEKRELLEKYKELDRGPSKVKVTKPNKS